MIERFNTIWFEKINQFAGINPLLDSAAKITAEYLVFVFILYLFYLWFKDKNITNKNLALYAGYAAVLGVMLNSLITIFYFHPRPFMVPVGTLLIQHEPETSFPSDHTTFMLSTAVMLIYYRETRMTGVALTIIGFIGGVARVFSGIHFPLDIIGSFGVALLSSFIIYVLRDKLKDLNRIIINLYLKLVNKKDT